MSTAIRVLYLDGFCDTHMAKLKRLAKTEVEATSLENEEMESRRVPTVYEASPRGLELAASATPDLYDLVVIGNNQGTGYKYARLLPPEMLRRTLVLWHELSPGDEQAYAKLGIGHFCSREAQEEYLLLMWQQLQLHTRAQGSPV